MEEEGDLKGKQFGGCCFVGITIIIFNQFLLNCKYEFNSLKKI